MEIPAEDRMASEAQGNNYRGNTMSLTIVYWALYYSSIYNIDPALVMSVIKVESGFKPNTVGLAGERGLMQLMPQYANVPKDKLFDIRTNIRVGVRKLAEFKQQCKHQVDNTWVVCFNLGVAGGAKVKHPTLWPYYKKIKQEYAAMSKKFKPGQRVVVLEAYFRGSNGEGTIIHESRLREYKGMWLVDLGDTILPVQTERLVDSDEYWAAERKKKVD